MDRCAECNRDREGAMFECPHCGALPGKSDRPASMPVSELDMHEHERAHRGVNRHVWIGCAIFLLGLTITVGSYLWAEEGETFIIAWGLMLVGGVQFVFGQWSGRGWI